MMGELIFLLDTCVWINLAESLSTASERRMNRALKELATYPIMTTAILKDEFTPNKILTSSQQKGEDIAKFVQALATPDSNSFNEFFFESYPKVIDYLDRYFLEHKQREEKHYLRKASKQATLSDGDLSMVLLPFMQGYKDKTFVVLTEDKINIRPSPSPSTKELTNPKRLFKLLKEEILPQSLPLKVHFPPEKKDSVEDILDVMERFCDEI